MGKKKIILAVCMISMLEVSGCGVLLERSTASTSEDMEISSETQSTDHISSAFVNTGMNEYVQVYQMPDTTSTSIARAYTGDAVEIYALQEQWYQVKLGEVTGYLQADYVTFSKPEPTAASTAISDTTTVSETPAETTTIAPVTTTAAPKTTPAATTVPKATTRTVSLTYLGQGTPNSNDGFTNLRETPSLSDNILCAVNNGSVLDVYSFGDSQWYYVQYDGVDGYMKKGYVQLLAEQSPTQNAAVKQYIGRGTSTSADGFLNVHSNPSLSSSNVVDTLPNGAYGDIFDYGDNTWYYIETARGYGYVKASYIHMLQPGEREELVYNSEFGYVSADIYG